MAWIPLTDVKSPASLPKLPDNPLPAPVEVAHRSVIDQPGDDHVSPTSQTPDVSPVKKATNAPVRRSVNGAPINANPSSVAKASGTPPPIVLHPRSATLQPLSERSYKILASLVNWVKNILMLFHWFAIPVGLAFQAPRIDSGETPPRRLHADMELGRFARLAKQWHLEEFHNTNTDIPGPRDKQVQELVRKTPDGMKMWREAWMQALVLHTVDGINDWRGLIELALKVPVFIPMLKGIVCGTIHKYLAAGVYPLGHAHWEFGETHQNIFRYSASATLDQSVEFPNRQPGEREIWREAWIAFHMQYGRGATVTHWDARNSPAARSIAPASIETRTYEGMRLNWQENRVGELEHQRAVQAAQAPVQPPDGTPVEPVQLKARRPVSRLPNGGQI